MPNRHPEAPVDAIPGGAKFPPRTKPNMPELKYTKAIVIGVENFIEKLNNEVNNSFSNGLGGIGVVA